MSSTRPPGHRLFAQYALAPNALGYCGPETAGGLEAVARGEKADIDVRAAARRFSGAWPYQQVLAELTGHDPLDEVVVRGYWTGNDLTAAVAPETFGRALLDLIGPQAGHYWAHLNDDLLAEAAPTHAFHVLAVYPWSRLLATGRPEPLDVLDSCRIGWGVVIEPPSGATVLVDSPALSYDGRLALTAPVRRSVDCSGASDLERGEVVALHWGRVCDRLDAAQQDALEHWTRWQLAASNPRITAEAVH